jgi:hypothetical protein
MRNFDNPTLLSLFLPTYRLSSDKSVAAAAAAEAVVEEALALGSGDNVTASVMLFSWQD